MLVGVNMASSKEFLSFILEQLSGLDISYKQMMGEFLLYKNGVLFGGIYDNRLLFKPTKIAKRLLINAKYDLPYPNAKPMIVCDFLDDKQKLIEFLTNI